MLWLCCCVCYCLQDQLGCADLAAAALRGTCCVLAALHSRTAAAATAAGTAESAANAAAAAALAGHVLQQLQHLAGTAATAHSDADNARRLAVAAAAPAAAAAALACNCLSQQQLAAAAQQAQQLASTAGVDGRLGGAAAMAWVQLACMRMCSSSSSSVSDEVSCCGQPVGQRLLAIKLHCLQELCLSGARSPQEAITLQLWQHATVRLMLFAADL